MDGDSEEEQDFGDVKGDYDSSDGDLSDDTSDDENSDAKRGRRRSHVTREIDQSPIISDANTSDYKRSKMFKGSVKIKKKSSIPNKSAVILRREFLIPLPTLPLLTRKNLGEKMIEFIWREFLNYDTDESELLLFEYVPAIINNINFTFSCELSPTLLNLKILEDDDYIEFKEFAEKLSNYFNGIDPGLSSSAQPKENYAATCCAQAACHQSDYATTNYFNDGYGKDAESVHSDSISGSSKKTRNDNMKHPYVSKINKKKEENNYQLRVAYTRFLADNNGILRNKHVLRIIDKLEIKYDTSNLPMFLVNRDYEDFLVPSFIDFIDIVDSLRILVEELENEAFGDITSSLSLPLWLKEQFLPSELMMFQHYFLTTLSDESDNKNAEHLNNLNNSDNGYKMEKESAEPCYSPLRVRNDDDSEIDNFDNFSLQSTMIEREYNHAVVTRFRGILKNMNAELSDPEAHAILSGYSKKDNGENRLCLDYTTFVTIFLRASSGALKCLPVKKALRELKSNLKVFEEIKVINQDPVPCVVLRTFGGSPVTCDFVVTGGRETLYEGGAYSFQITLKSGHPYECPSVLFLTRVASVNVFNKIDGTGQLPHLNTVWDASWTLKRLLEHIISLLKEPDLTLISPVYMQTAITWTYSKLMHGERERMEIERKELVLENDVDDGGDNGKESVEDNYENEEKWHEVERDAGIDRNEDDECSEEKLNNENYGGRETSIIHSDYKDVEDIGGKESGGGEEEDVGRDEGKEGDRAEKQNKEVGEREGEGVLVIRKDRNVLEVGEIDDEPVLTYLRSVVPSGVFVDGSALQFSTLAAAEDQLNRFSKLEQIHLNSLCLYLYDNQQYVDMVKMFVEMYSLPLPQPEVYDPEMSYNPDGSYAGSYQGSYESASSAVCDDRYEGENAPRDLEETKSIENTLAEEDAEEVEALAI